MTCGRYRTHPIRNSWRTDMSQSKREEILNAVRTNAKNLMEQAKPAAEAAAASCRNLRDRIGEKWETRDEVISSVRDNAKGLMDQARPKMEAAAASCRDFKDRVSEKLDDMSTDARIRQLERDAEEQERLASRAEHFAAQLKKMGVKKHPGLTEAEGLRAEADRKAAIAADARAAFEAAVAARAQAAEARAAAPQAAAAPLPEPEAAPAAVEQAAAPQEPDVQEIPAEPVPSALSSGFGSIFDNPPAAPAQDETSPAGGAIVDTIEASETAREDAPAQEETAEALAGQ
ncbi:MAG: hypothetical protein MJ061_00970, partial [Mailhella sp.]|nr:hypothetical protein [Mailhella sp.]